MDIEMQFRGLLACLTIVALVFISTRSLERILVKQNKKFSKMGFFGPVKGGKA